MIHEAEFLQQNTIPFLLIAFILFIWAHSYVGLQDIEIQASLANEMNANYAMPDNLRATSLSLSMEFATMRLQCSSFRFVPFIIKVKGFQHVKGDVIEKPYSG